MATGGPTSPSSRPQRIFDASHMECVTASEKATRLIRELAEEQHGVVARRQLLDLGLGEGLIQDRVKQGRLLQVHYGVFALGHRRIGLRGEWMAAVLACGPNAALSLGSAAHLWGIRGSYGPIEVIRTSGHRRPHGVRLHQTRSLPPDDVQLKAGIPVTSPERTVLDIAGRLDAIQMRRILVAADRSRILRWPELRRVLDRPGGRKGVKRLRRVAAEVDPRAVDARSPLEEDFLSLCQGSNLPLPEINVLVEGRLVDFYWPRERLVVETDGYAFHSDRPAFERDRESTAALMAAGYTVLRATYRMLERNPDSFLALVRQSLQTWS